MSMSIPTSNNTSLKHNLSTTNTLLTKINAEISLIKENANKINSYKNLIKKINEITNKIKATKIIKERMSKLNVPYTFDEYFVEGVEFVKLNEVNFSEEDFEGIFREFNEFCLKEGLSVNGSNFVADDLRDNISGSVKDQANLKENDFNSQIVTKNRDICKPAENLAEFELQMVPVKEKDDLNRVSSGLRALTVTNGNVTQNGSTTDLSTSKSPEIVSIKRNPVSETVQKLNHTLPAVFKQPDPPIAVNDVSKENSASKNLGQHSSLYAPVEPAPSVSVNPISEALKKFHKFPIVVKPSAEKSSVAENIKKMDHMLVVVNPPEARPNVAVKPISETTKKLGKSSLFDFEKPESIKPSTLPHFSKPPETAPNVSQTIKKLEDKLSDSNLEHKIKTSSQFENPFERTDDPLLATEVINQDNSMLENPFDSEIPEDPFNEIVDDDSGSSASNPFDEEIIDEVPQYTFYDNNPIEDVLVSSNVSGVSGKLNYALNELVSTEKTYLSHLKLLFNNFYAPLLKYMTKLDRDVLFCNVNSPNTLERIISLHESIDVSKLNFDKKEFEVYLDYCPYQMNALKLLNKLNPDAKEFIKKTSSKIGVLNLGALLLEPMQRITRYPLLLRQILHYSETKNQKLIELLNFFEGLLKRVNGACKLEESKTRLKELKIPLSELIVFEGVLIKAKSKRRLYGVLTTNCFVLVEKKKEWELYRDVMDLRRIRVIKEVNGFSVEFNGKRISLVGDGKWLQKIHEAMMVDSPQKKIVTIGTINFKIMFLHFSNSYSSTKYLYFVIKGRPWDSSRIQVQKSKPLKCFGRKVKVEQDFVFGVGSLNDLFFVEVYECDGDEFVGSCEVGVSVLEYVESGKDVELSGVNLLNLQKNVGKLDMRVNYKGFV